MRRFPGNLQLRKEQNKKQMEEIKEKEEIRECKNKNEYWCGNKLYIRAIRKCTCEEKSGDVYRLSCKIIERGERSYCYKPGDVFLARMSREDPNDKRLWLTPEAIRTIEQTIAGFEARVAAVKTEFVKATAKELNMDIYYKYQDGLYDLAIIWNGPNGPDRQIILFGKCDLTEMVSRIRFHVPYSLKEKCDVAKSLIEPTAEIIEINPLYVAAGKTGDEKMQKLLKLYYHIATEEECLWLQNTLGVRVLPSLSEEYNRNYYVRGDEISENLLDHSGYTILHRPYFAMMNSTHSIWTLNPHTKIGVDAAKKDVTTISFSEYLAMFEGEDKEH